MNARDIINHLELKKCQHDPTLFYIDVDSIKTLVELIRGEEVRLIKRVLHEMCSRLGSISQNKQHWKLVDESIKQTIESIGR